MERSRLGVLICLILSLTGLGLVVGIIVYNQTNLNAQQVQPMSQLDTGVFQVAEEEIREFWIAMDGKTTLHCKRASAHSHWSFTEQQDLPVDQKQLDRYLSQLLRIGFSGDLTLASAPDLAEYGLDHPAYQLRIQLASGEAKGLLVGNRIAGSTLRYALLQEPGSKISTWNDSLLLLRKRPSDFYRSDPFSLTEEVEKFTLSFPPRGLRLDFERNAGREWELREPSLWQANPSQLNATLHNLLYLSVQHYVALPELETLGVDTTTVSAEVVLESSTQKKQFRFYSDKLGNYYALQAGSKWVAELPNSIKLILQQPVTLLLNPFPQLPRLTEVESLQWNHTQLVQREGEWYRDGVYLLSPKAVSRLEVWYNELNRRPLISTHIPLRGSTGMDRSQNQDHLVVRDVQKREYEVNWVSCGEGVRDLWMDGQDSGFEVPVPKPLPDLKERVNE